MNPMLLAIFSLTVGMSAGAAYASGGGFVDFLMCGAPMLIGCAIVWIGKRWFE
jgi:hypothetical protein